jgi:cysteine/O-acetylserine efflux protein
VATRTEAQIKLSVKLLILSVSAMILALVGFCAISTWALAGSLIRTHLQQPKIRATVNYSLVLLLIYTAIELSGILG